MVQAKFFIMLIICIIFFICAWRFVLKCYIRSRSEIQDQDMDFVNRNVNDEINKSLVTKDIALDILRTDVKYILSQVNK